MNIVTLEQKTADWHAARLGKFGASGLNELIAKRKDGKGYLATHRERIRDKAIERLTGAVVQNYVSKEMQHGTDFEDEARAAYELHARVFVEQVGWVQHPELPFSGASPDGLVDDDGLVEIKCPTTAKHLDTIIGADPAIGSGEYLYQMQWQMACTGRAWCDFCSYDPRVPDKLKLYVVRIPRDEEVIAMIRAEIEAANAEVDAYIAQLHAYQSGTP